MSLVERMPVRRSRECEDRDGQVQELVDAEYLSVLGVRIANLSQESAIDLMRRLVARGGVQGARAIYIVNAHTLNLATDRPHYRALLNSADAVFGDGVGVRLAARRQGNRMRANLVGTDLVPLFFTRTIAQSFRYFLLGGRDDVVRAAAQHVRQQFPGLNMVGFHHGHFTREENPDVVRRINATRPDIVLVAMGNPIQEEWIYENRSVLGAKLCVGVGGLVDHWGGVLKRAPGWARRHGLEWAQLLLQQPHKWRRYLIGNPKFVYRVLTETHAFRHLDER